MAERATTDVFEGNSSDLISCSTCDWYRSKLELSKKADATVEKMKTKQKLSAPPYPYPSFYCDNYDKCKRAILIGALDLAYKLKEMGIIDEISQGPTYVAAIVGEW